MEIYEDRKENNLQVNENTFLNACKLYKVIQGIIDVVVNECGEKRSKVSMDGETFGLLCGCMWVYIVCYALNFYP